MITKNVTIPDLGGASDVDVIEVNVAPGDKISIDDPLITLEGDKASMEVPSPYEGVIKDIKMRVGDKVSEGGLILTMQVEGEDIEEALKEEPAATAKKEPAILSPAATKPEFPTTEVSVHAGPAVRRLARELEMSLSQIKGSGPKGRITKEDLKAALTGGGSAGLGVAPMPKIDFSKFGETETQPLNKIKRLTGTNLHRNWVTVPHVTQFDEADITELEAFRKSQKKTAEEHDVKLTPLVFIMKAVIAALKEFPQFNASLDPSGEQLILKKYFNIGVAVDTPNGLVVPVVRDVDKKGLFQLARELGEISEKAREKGLAVSDMEGSCFTISSLGGIGGTAFTPIVNCPDVAILGVSKAKMQPVFIDAEFKPRLMMPLSLSYDHRVIDGADGVRFTTFLGKLLGDIRRLIL